MIDTLVFETKLNVVKELLQGGDILDIGCGDKRYTRHIPNCIGIDSHEQYEGIKNCPDIFMDARDLKFSNNSFDGLICLDVLEHIPEVDTVVKEAWRVLKPNGVMVITDPNDTVLFWARLLCGRFKKAFEGNPDHIHRFDKDKMINMTKSLFKLEKVIYRGIFTGYKFRKKSVTVSRRIEQ